MTILLQYLPPVTSSTPSISNKNLHNSKIFGIARTKKPLRVVASAKPKTKTKTTSTTQEDDYFATLKALKSKGRTPRKSLGQVKYSVNMFFG